MELPFTAEQFLAVFERYNQAIWPLQVVAYALGLAAVILAVRPVAGSDRIISAILASFWLWMGAVYHLQYFVAINSAAVAFGVLFVVQGMLWLLVGVVRGRLAFQPGPGPSSLLGGLLILYAMVVYPLIGAYLGHGYPRSPSFGVAPCPTAIFTFGLLLWTRAAVPTYVLAIPLAWSVVGFGAALALGIREDVGLLIAGVVATSLLVWRDGWSAGSNASNRRQTPSSRPSGSVVGAARR
jgi:hypothetical protein